MSIPKTKARKAFPGDAARVLLEPATDTLGRDWQRGEVFTPICGGHDNVKGCRYVEFGAPRARFENAEG